jgi:DnaJ-class molecular chaperone
VSRPQEQTADPTCQPCRGTGRVISNLGGTPHDLPCPWCDGTGQVIPEHDAQKAHPQGAEGDRAA